MQQTFQSPHGRLPLTAGLNPPPPRGKPNALDLHPHKINTSNYIHCWMSLTDRQSTAANATSNTLLATAGDIRKARLPPTPDQYLGPLHARLFFVKYFIYSALSEYDALKFITTVLLVLFDLLQSFRKVRPTDATVEFHSEPTCDITGSTASPTSQTDGLMYVIDQNAGKFFFSKYVIHSRSKKANNV
jgi:hypothetical protein